MRKVLITGGTGNIGAKLVKAMLADGHIVYFTTRSESKGIELIQTLEPYKERCKLIKVDFTSENATEIIGSQIRGELDVIIHNARSLDTLKIDNEGRVAGWQFEKELKLGVIFPYELTNAIIDWNVGLKDVVFISSMYGVVGPTPSLYENFEMQSPINYGVTKAAQIHLTKELGIRLAHKGIRVNAVSYGGVEGRADEMFKERYAKLSPLGRMLSEADLYPPIQYILNNPHLAITGENLKVDGGWTLW